MRESLQKYYLRLGNAERKGWIKPGSEDQEQIKVIRFLEENHYKFTAIPNSTYTTSIKQKIMNYLMGVRPGLCDILIVLKTGSLLFIEMKKKRGKRGGSNGSKVSLNQKDWIKTLNTVDNVAANVCYGGDEAISEIMKYDNF